MRRFTVAALAAATVAFAWTANAQPAIDFSKIEIKTIDLGNKT